MRRILPASFVAIASILLLPAVAAAAPIDRTITINVYQICDDAGANCASTGYAGHEFYAAETNAIWAQAGISITFAFQGQIHDSTFLTIDDTAGSGHGFADLQTQYGLADYFNNVVDMFLVRGIDGKRAYGEGWQGGAGLVMDMDLIMGYGNRTLYPNGRIDTMAHELGHNLGLDPTDDPQYAGPGDPGHSNDPHQLMASGGIRTIPGTLADINPNGLGLDQFSDFQILVARESPILRDLDAPEPATFGLLVLGLIVAIGRGKSRRPSIG